MDTINHRTAWIILAVVSILALGLVWWATTDVAYPVADSGVQVGTNAVPNSGGTGAQAGTQAGNTSGTSGTGGAGASGTGGTTGANTTPNRNLTISITGFHSANTALMPIMSYTLMGNVAGDMISIVGKQGGEVVYITEQPVYAGGKYTLNLNDLDRGDGSKTAVAPGEYFLRISEKSGKILTQSGFFMVRAGKGETQ
jgi:hypothetical protein